MMVALETAPSSPLSQVCKERRGLQEEGVCGDALPNRAGGDESRRAYSGVVVALARGVECLGDNCIARK